VDRTSDRSAGRLPVRFQRAESAAIAVVLAAAFHDLGFAWWWLLVLFLVFDASMIGYAHSPRLGAWTYNAVHSYLGPSFAAVVALVSDHRWAAFVALTWGFHIAVDRLLGYGLKFTDRFTHTHLGVPYPRPSAGELAAGEPWQDRVPTTRSAAR
jgi:hypothetical protein